MTTVLVATFSSGYPNRPGLSVFSLCLFTLSKQLRRKDEFIETSLSLKKKVRKEYPESQKPPILKTFGAISRITLKNKQVASYIRPMSCLKPG